MNRHQSPGEWVKRTSHAGRRALAMLLALACVVSSLGTALAQDSTTPALPSYVQLAPGEQLAAVARYCLAHAACNVVGVHLFSFGGAPRAAAWMAGAIAQGSGA